MYITREPQKPGVRIVSLTVVLLLLVAIGFGVAIGVRRGFFQAVRHPVFRYDTPAWVPEFGGTLRASTFLLTGERAGSAELNLPIAELAKQLSPWVYDVVPEVKDGSLFEHYIVQDEAGQRLLELVPYCEGVCRIQQITVLSPRFITDAGIRIGSPYADVVTHHTITEIIRSGGVYLVNTAEGIIYAIPIEYYDGRGDYPDALRIGELADDAVVSYMVLQV